MRCVKASLFWEFCEKELINSKHRDGSTELLQMLGSVTLTPRHAFFFVLAVHAALVEGCDPGDSESLFGLGLGVSLAPLPTCTAKLVHFVRHGVAAHNVYTGPDACNSLALYDPALVKSENALVVNLGTELARANVRVDVFISSPLMRTLQTTNLVREAMLQGTNLPAPRVLVKEDARERFCGCTENCRGSVSFGYKTFPGFDFSGVESDSDPLVSISSRTGGRRGDYEHDDALSARAERFLLSLEGRPEAHIVVVSHYTFIQHVIKAVGRLGDSESTLGFKLGPWSRVQPGKLPSYVVLAPGENMRNCQVVSFELRLEGASAGASESRPE